MTTPEDPTKPVDRSATEEFREGLTHLFAAARKVASTVEPQVTRSLEEAEGALARLGREGEVAVGEVSREVATFAARLADKLREAAERADPTKPSQRPPPGEPGDQGPR